MGHEMQSALIEILRGVPLFAGARAETLDGLTVGAFAQWFPPGVTLHERNEVPDFIFVVLDGAVEQTFGGSEAQSTMRIVRPPAPFAVPSCILQAPTQYATSTIKRSRILMLPVQNMRAALEADIAVAHSLLRYAMEGWVDTALELHKQKVHNSSERLAHWILGQLDEDGTMELPFQKRRLAALVGTTPENLSRNIALLREHGVEFDGRRVVVSDIDALRALAGRAGEAAAG